MPDGFRLRIEECLLFGVDRHFRLEIIGPEKLGFGSQVVKGFRALIADEDAIFDADIALARQMMSQCHIPGYELYGATLWRRAASGSDLPATLNAPVASDSRDGYALG